MAITVQARRTPQSTVFHPNAMSPSLAKLTSIVNPATQARRLRLAAAACALFTTAAGAATTPGELLAGYARQAGTGAQAARGQQLFTSRQGRDWSCASCHGARPVAAGQHASTGKSIEPLAPAANAQRFADAARTEKWFRRNCKDVLGRPCSAAEKADVLAWLITLEP